MKKATDIKPDRKILKVLDNEGLIIEGENLYKVIRYNTRRHNIVYKKIDPKEYDERIERIANKILSYPEVSVKDIIKDALYDLPLKLLDQVEERLKEEEAKADQEERKPKIKSKTQNRGTCVDLEVNGKFLMNLRS